VTDPLDREKGGWGNPPSWYVADVPPPPVRPALDGDLRADVCIVGGGYTGLSAALHLAEAGRKVVLVEAHRVSWGASGRNGGQLHSGQRRDQAWLERAVGKADARRLWDFGEEAKALVRDLVARHAIDCALTDGLIDTVHKPRLVAGEHAYVEKLRKEYGYQQIEALDRDALAAAIGTSRYFGGFRDRGAAHLNPLAFALGLGRAAEAAGARLFEQTRATRLVPGPPHKVETSTGTVTAETVVLAGNGYLYGIAPEVEVRVMPIRNYILATEPLGARLDALIPGREAVSDSRFVVRYWRPSRDGRLLFGGGETYGYADPSDLKRFVRRHMLEVYPDLADVAISHAWGGTLAVTPRRAPLVRRLAPGLYVGAGYSGQGVGTAPFAGKIIAEAIIGDTGRLDVFARLPVPAFPGGTLLRAPLLVLAMTWFALRDRL
jgi:gamma-glutamylputrescine oxidase